ncbi:MAG: helix-turn-helix transcriptional regulator [Clostridia bacterium]|nr:helix-turn-helix transcriptional regulator [Clostridia bacterium]
MSLGSKIKQLRKQAGMTQSELAGRLGISPSAVGMYEQDRREPDRRILSKLCGIFGVSGDFFIRSDKSAGSSVEVSEVFDEFTRRLTTQEGLMFDGEPLNNEDRMKIIDAIKVVAAIATQQHRKMSEGST